MRALVVDDSKAIRLLIGRIMTEFGFDVDEAEDGQAALERLAAGPLPDVMLLDWNMPRRTGFEVVQALRADARYAELRIVMVTTETEMSQVIRALEAGANEYVMKPFNRDILREKLELLALPVR